MGEPEGLVDLKTLLTPKVSGKDHGKKNIVGGNDDVKVREEEKKRKRSKKEVVWSEFNPQNKKPRKGNDHVVGTDSSSNVKLPSGSKTLSSRKECYNVMQSDSGSIGKVTSGSDELRGFPLSVMVPTRPRVLVGRKKCERPPDMLNAADPIDGSVSVQNGHQNFQDDQDNDEESLEQTAAMILSSRFDPSVLGHVANSSAGFKSPPAETGQSGKGISRKRRHFYEIVSKGLDGEWFLNRRIKVFWPLDGTWYSGVVNSYDPDSQLHHVKYDDKDNEWINLEDEKFKLLLLRNEVPDQARLRKSSKKCAKSSAHKGNEILVKDEDNSGDSEPIISWLAPPSRHVKPLPNPLKKQRTILSPSSSISGFLHDEAHNTAERSESLQRDYSHDGEKVVQHFPVLYGRRRFHSKCERLSKMRKSFNKISGQTMRKHVHERGEGSFYFRKHFRNEAGESLLRRVIPDALVMNNMQSKLSYKSSSGSTEYDMLSLSVTNYGIIKSRIHLITSKQFRLEMQLPTLPFLEYLVGRTDFQLARTMFLIQHGKIIIASPLVQLELLIIDRSEGAKVLLLEGCLRQAMSIIFLILKAVNQPNQLNMQAAMTSISFRLSIFQDPGKQHMFAFNSLTTKICYLKSKLLRNFMLVGSLSISECTYVNIKTLGYRGLQLWEPCIGVEPSASQGILSAGSVLSSSSEQELEKEVSASDADQSYSFPDLWKDRLEKADFTHSCFSRAPKKRRTRIHYGSVNSGYIFQANKRAVTQRAVPFRRVIRTSKMRIFDGNRKNVRAASIKNILIPGVRLVEENDNVGMTVPFIRNPTMYLQQSQTDIEMAIDPSNVLYDMDTDDEEWLGANNKSSALDNSRCGRISEPLFEKIMDMFEKVSYVQQRDLFSSDEIEDLVTGLGSTEAAKIIYNHWLQKRERRGMPLVRQFQCAPWERYQKQLLEWEHAVARGTHVNRVPTEKPPMFAFCLKPRGLVACNRSSRKRAYKRVPVSRPNCAAPVDHDGFDASERTIGNGDSIQFQELGSAELISERDYTARLRAASSAAEHTSKMAKLKREKAKRLFENVDEAIHKAMVALMKADAVKAAYALSFKVSGRCPTISGY